MSLRIALASNTAWYLFNFRGGLISAFLREGFGVIALAPPDDYSVRLATLGCEVVDLPMDNMGTNPLRDLATWRDFRRAYRKTRPDVVLHYTIKPVLYGTFAARSLGIPVVNTITGLGTAFLRGGPLQAVVERLYRVSQRWPRRIFFQNPDDRELFVRRGLVAGERVGLLPGSGVDLERFGVRPAPGRGTVSHSNKGRSQGMGLHGGEADSTGRGRVPAQSRPRNAPVFLLIARLLWDKGVGEFVEAARILRREGLEARFQLLGPLGVANRTAVPRSELDRWVGDGLVEYLGETDDVRPWIERADCAVLPSYREGTPRTLLEAAAMGRPVIAADVPGCREVLEDGVNGLFCLARDATDLAEKMRRMAAMAPERRADMGLAGRGKMEREFVERIVIRRYLQAIDDAVGAI